MELAIFHSVNAGLYLWGEGVGLWIDGIHAGTEQGFSVMPSVLADQLGRHTGFFAHTDGLLFTHLHRDHFHPEGLHTALHTPHPPLVYGPQLLESSVRAQELCSGLKQVRMGPAIIYALKTIHDGESSVNDPHESFLLQLSGASIFVAGDALFRAEQADLLRCRCSAPVDAAFCNLYQIASPEGQEFLRRLNASRVLLYHLPFPEDDRFCSYPLARSAVRRYPTDLPPLEIPTHMSWLDGHTAPWTTSTKEAVFYAVPGIQRDRPLLQPSS